MFRLMHQQLEVLVPLGVEVIVDHLAARHPRCTHSQPVKEAKDYLAQDILLCKHDAVRAFSQMFLKKDTRTPTIMSTKHVYATNGTNAPQVSIIHYPRPSILYTRHMQAPLRSIHP